MRVKNQVFSKTLVSVYPIENSGVIMKKLKRPENFRFLSMFFVLATFTLLLSGTSNAIQVTEIMYHPQKEEALYEFLEIYNETSSKRDIGGWAFVKGIDFAFPASTIIEPKSYLVIAPNPEAITSKYNIKNVAGPFAGELQNSSGRIVLTDLAGGVMIDVTYKSSGAWLVAPDGSGHSLAKVSPRLNPNQPENWRASLEMGGTPGKNNGFDLGITPAKTVINEVFANTKGSQFIELYNPLAVPFDISGYWLSNAPDNLKLYRIPPKTVLPAKGYMHFKHLKFTLNATGGRAFLTNRRGTMVLDAVAFDKTPLEMSQGRYPDDVRDWYSMSPSPTSANSVNLNTDVVINEIMYHPPTDADGDEYIELYNSGRKSVDVSGWRFSRGISFEFSKGTIIPAKGYLVVAKDRDRLISKYRLSSSLVVGNCMGTLSNGGEKVQLRDNIGNKVDEVRYYDGGHWPKYADGYGSSLELIDPHHDNSNYQAWAPSDETKKAEWTHVSYSGTYRGYSGGYRVGSELHLHLLSAGEMLIDDISLTSSKGGAWGTVGIKKRSKGVELLKNGSFETGLGNWVVVGNHVQSHIIDTDKKKGSKCLKIVATGHGDTGPNHIEQSTSTPMRGNTTSTISFWAKWQWGNNLLVTRCLNNAIPKTHRIPIPKLTGTPGKRNSVAKPNLGPVFKNTRHQPVIPKPSDTVYITTRVVDPDGVRSITLFYKADAGRVYLKTKMYDDGKHNDGGVADGIYGGVIAPKQFTGQTVAFYIQAKDSKGNSNTFPTNTNRPCIYRVESRKVTSKFPVYRLILTAADVRKLRRRPSLSNEPLNCTFIFDEKDVYYNVTCRYTGSPFGRGGGGYRGYKVAFNADEKLHGVKRQARFDRNDGNFNERIAYRLQRQLRLPTCQQEWVYVLFNGRSEGVMEDILPPSKRYLEIFYPNDDDGQLFEVDDRFVFQKGYSRYGRARFTNLDATFQWLNTDNKDVYRWNYEIRNHDREDDYTHLIQMLKVMNKTPRANYESAIDNITNVDEWLRLMAARTVIADWDFFVATRGKNAYLYRPNGTGKWEILGWDSELTFQQVDMSIWSRFPAIRRFQRSPKHQHLYYTYIQELLDKYFTSAALGPWLEHYYSRIGRAHHYSMKAFIDSRSRYLRRIIPKATVSITTNGGKPISVKGNKIALAGTAPVQTRWVRVANKDYYLDWMGPTNWKVSLPLQPGKNKLILAFLDYDKKPVGKDSIQVTAKR